MGRETDHALIVSSISILFKFLKYVSLLGFMLNVFETIPHAPWDLLTFIFH